jgi:hypothetical protein
LLEAIQLTAARKALVTILEDAPTTGVLETALLSEQALAKDWDQPEEDEAWSHLQPERIASSVASFQDSIS